MCFYGTFDEFRIGGVVAVKGGGGGRSSNDGEASEYVNAGALCSDATNGSNYTSPSFALVSSISHMMCGQICGLLNKLTVNLCACNFINSVNIFLQGLLSSTSAAEVVNAAPKNDTSDGLNTFYFYEVSFRRRP